uniref:Crk-like protein n=1 Tax=Ciona intestinalis TaxID=7719 RepID=H2XM64_CIOIN
MASANFNSADEDSWYFGMVSRKDSQNKLLHQKHGSFLVRDSTTCPGDYVLSVSENSKVSHYIINKQENRLKIGDQMFDSMPELLDFYKVHYLDTTTLIEPIPKLKEPEVAKKREGLPMMVRALFDFKSDDVDDLPFSKHEILEVIEKPEENWWNARNAQGRIGQIPVPYVEPYVMNRNSTPGTYQMPGAQKEIMHQQKNSGPKHGYFHPTPRPTSMPSRTGPVFAEVITRRVPNAYDPTALALEVGDRIQVTQMNKSGQWEGICNNKQGKFPFTHVKLIDFNDSENDFR